MISGWEALPPLCPGSSRTVWPASGWSVGAGVGDEGPPDGATGPGAAGSEKVDETENSGVRVAVDAAAAGRDDESSDPQPEAKIRVPSSKPRTATTRQALCLPSARIGSGRETAGGGRGIDGLVGVDGVDQSLDQIVGRRVRVEPPLDDVRRELLHRLGAAEVAHLLAQRG